MATGSGEIFRPPTAGGYACTGGSPFSEVKAGRFTRLTPWTVHRPPGPSAVKVSFVRPERLGTIYSFLQISFFTVAYSRQIVNLYHVVFFRTAPEKEFDKHKGEVLKWGPNFRTCLKQAGMPDQRGFCPRTNCPCFGTARHGIALQYGRRDLSCDPFQRSASTTRAQALEALFSAWRPEALETEENPAGGGLRPRAGAGHARPAGPACGPRLHDGRRLRRCVPLCRRMPGHLGLEAGGGLRPGRHRRRLPRRLRRRHPHRAGRLRARWDADAVAGGAGGPRPPRPRPGEHAQDRGSPHAGRPAHPRRGYWRRWPWGA